MVLLGILSSYLKQIFPDKSKLLFRIGLAAGVLSALVMTYFKLYTSKIDTSLWNLYIFMFVIGVSILLFVFRMLGRVLPKAADMLSQCCITLLVISLLFYYLPPFFEIPHTILLTQKTVISTVFILGILGAVFGLILTFLAGAAVHKGTLALGKSATAGALAVVSLINGVKFLGLSVGIMLSKRLIGSNHTLFIFSKYVNNYSSWFIFLVMAVCLFAAVLVLVQAGKQNEPYENPAQKRKILAKWKRRVRWSVTNIITACLVIVTLTLISAYANREVQLSPIEDAREENGNIYVSFDQVDDGKLHRFGYTTESGKVVRFIVIKKPNSSAYGIGLDACDICGETGYYEKDGKVICNLCDVVMNINTIGFKGGCNPIVIDYSIENGHIIVPVSTLEEHESVFK